MDEWIRDKMVTTGLKIGFFFAVLKVQQPNASRGVVKFKWNLNIFSLSPCCCLFNPL